jgi:8-oxo-dGTP pyrophosphatase MutT (NUDIX family)
MYKARTIYSKKFSAADIKISGFLGKEWVANSSYDELVQAVWKQKEQLAKEDGVKIWDGMYYRVENVSEIEKSGELRFELGTVPYRYIATVIDLQDSFVANKFDPLCHLSTAAMIRTSDGFYVFGKRSRNGMVDLIGGGAQQDEMVINSGIDLERNLRKEVYEETSISESHIRSVQGIGIVRSMTSNTILISTVQLNVSRDQVRDIFKDRLEDEMSDLLYVSDVEIEFFLRKMSSYRPLIADFL